MARAADKFTIEERIERISAIFNTFRNPDKETVLTPWRVVNMHMSDCLGGWCFYDEAFQQPLSEPRFVDQGKVTTDVFRPDAHILEINSKSGLYPLYVAYNVYRARVAAAKAKYGEVSHGFALQLWDATIEENILVICKTPMAKSITRRTLAGFRDTRVNAKYYPDLIKNISERPEAVVNTFRDGKRFWKINQNEYMKLDAIVGNPPYQLTVAKKETENGQKAVINIFHYFQILANKLRPRYSSLIYPGGRWIHQSGKGLAEFGFEQINDVHLSLIEFFPDCNQIFKDAGIADGISIVLKDYTKKTSGFHYKYADSPVIELANPGEKLLPLNPRDSIIVNQIEEVVKSKNFSFLHDAVLSRSLFSIESDFVEKNPSLVREYDEKCRFNPEKEIKLFTNDKAGKAGRARWYVVKRKVITSGLEYLDKWKVVVSSANAGGQKRSNQIAVLDNHSAFGRARVALKTFETEKEAWNFLAYAKSKLIRFAFLLTDESLTSLAKLVPDILDYRDENGIINFEGDINTQLYELFNIGSTEQEHIQMILSQKAE